MLTQSIIKLSGEITTTKRYIWRFDSEPDTGNIARWTGQRLRDVPTVVPWTFLALEQRRFWTIALPSHDQFGREATLHEHEQRSSR